MNIVVISPEYNLSALVDQCTPNNDWRITHFCNIDSFKYFVNYNVAIDGIIWSNNSLHLDHLKECIRLKNDFNNTPILMITQKNQDKGLLEKFSSKVSMLHEAEDAEQRIASVKEFINHALHHHNQNKLSGIVEIYPNILLNVDMHCLINGNRMLPLPGKEFELLMYFIENRSRFVNIEEILHTVWDQYTTPENARQYIYKLRIKLKNEKVANNILIHRKGIGYILLDKKTESLLRISGDNAV
ncbi:winged helix-turn-helix domain-containing protein [Priestia koreensis]|uniref:winged helix-turn-helix domain-containing protein n=1 Tax=Priestia koreensis TaxID=284581 RepID=UPI003D0121F2